MFEPVTRETLSSQIRDRLLARIGNGELEAGARVPSERALSDQFQVARTSVREAMQGLLSLGVIERRGNRWFVAERLPDLSLDRADDRKEFIRQLFETRRVLELPIVELAAARASDRERAEIKSLSNQFHESMPLEEFRELDRAFHSAIARACGNPLLVEVYSKVLARLFRSEAISSLLSDITNRAEVRLIIAQSAATHATIAGAVADGDTKAAVAAGTKHLNAVEQGMIDRLV
ncbi:MAG: FCD domain-containing protein [Actinomycetota bacterium]|nr:FCD domain-containing protein [Actinomycetota bacterium]